MDTILFIIKNNDMDDMVKNLVDNFKKGVYDNIKIIEESHDDIKILTSCHILKGYFSNKDLQHILRNNQKPINIKRNLPTIKRMINKELEKFN